MKNTIALLFTAIKLMSGICFSQSCNPDSLHVYQVSAHQTDSNIPPESQKHIAFVNLACAHKNLLMLFLVGTNADPASTLYFPELAANNGYNVVSLKYPNNVSAQTPCRNNPDEDCYENFRREILEGIDYSPYVSVDSANCVYNRLLKLLVYLNDHYPQQGWDHYFSGNTILWNHILVAGHSQGGGHVALIAKDHAVKRVIMFASPNDYSDYFGGPALWTTKPHVTSTGLYYAFGNTTDEIVDFTEQFQQWDALGLDNYGDTVSVDLNLPPYAQTHELYTSYDPAGNIGNHYSVVVDNWTPLNADGIPQFEPVWKYMVGIPLPRSSETSGESFSLGDIQFISALKNTETSFADLPFPARLIVADIVGRSVIDCKVNSQGEINNRVTQLQKGFYCYCFISEKGVVLESGKLFLAQQQ